MCLLRDKQPSGHSTDAASSCCSPQGHLALCPGDSSALGTAVPISWLTACPRGAKGSQGAECPQGKEGTSSAPQTLCRHSQEPFLSQQTTFKGFSSGTVKQLSSEPQKVRSESSVPLTWHNPAPGSPRGNRKGLAEDPRQAGRADPHGLLMQGSPAAIPALALSQE